MKGRWWREDGRVMMGRWCSLEGLDRGVEVRGINERLLKVLDCVKLLVT